MKFFLSSVLLLAIGRSYADDHEHHESCACAAQEMDFVIDCDDTGPMLAAVAVLANNNCDTSCSSEICEKNFFIVQAHHDYCLEGEVPETVENALHIYEDNCDECEILKKVDPSLPSCPAHTCDSSGTNAYQAALSANCLNDCSSSTCRTNFQTLKAVHDLCSEDTLSLTAEAGFHSMEEACEDQSCNVGDATLEMEQLICTEDEHGDEHETCACSAVEHDFDINCAEVGVMNAAVAALSANNCDSNCDSEICEKNFHIVQAHHDHCLESEVPGTIENALHIYEDNCEHCEITRKFDSSLPQCPSAACNNLVGNAAYQTLLSANCLNNCNSATCISNFQTLKRVHDDCDEDTLSLSAESGFHSMEEACEDHNCNVGTGASILTCETSPFMIIGVCFSGDSTVNMEDGSTVAVKDVKIGDRVQVSTDGKFDTVYSFGHYAPNAMANFHEITTTTTNNKIQLSANHMIRVQDGSFVPAAALEVGTTMHDGAKVTKIVTQVQAKGVFAPFTTSGTILVNGMESSSYVAFTQTGDINIAGITFSGQWLAHSFEFPHRVACHYLGGSAAERMCNSYNADGVSTFVEKPLEFFTYVTSTKSGFYNIIVMMAMVPLLMVFSAVEFVVFQQPLLLVAAALAFMAAARGQKKLATF